MELLCKLFHLYFTAENFTSGNLCLGACFRINLIEIFSFLFSLCFCCVWLCDWIDLKPSHHSPTSPYPDCIVWNDTPIFFSLTFSHMSHFIAYHTCFTAENFTCLPFLSVSQFNSSIFKWVLIFLVHFTFLNISPICCRPTRDIESRVNVHLS